MVRSVERSLLNGCWIGICLTLVNEQILPPREADLLHSQYQALLEISEAIAVHRDLNELFHDLAQRLPRIVPFDFINLVLHDPTREVMRLHALVAPETSTIRPGLELPIDESPAGCGVEKSATLDGRGRGRGGGKPFS